MLAAAIRRQAAEREARVEAWAEQSGTAALAGRNLSPAGVALADRNIDAAARWLKDHGATGTLASLQAGGVPRAPVKYPDSGVAGFLILACAMPCS